MARGPRPDVAERRRAHHLTATPKISVVLPTHDRAALPPRAIASVQAQRYENWELVIVDDASSDSTHKVLAALDDPRIRSIRVAHNRVSAARNAALAEATGYVIDDVEGLPRLLLKPHSRSAPASTSRWSKWTTGISC